MRLVGGDFFLVRVLSKCCLIKESCLEALLGSVSKSTEQIIAILSCPERRGQILCSVLLGKSCSLALPVYFIRAIQIMLKNFVHGACLAYVRDVPFFIPLSTSELFIRGAAALPVLPSLMIGTETRCIRLPGHFGMQYFTGCLRHTYKNTFVVIVAGSVVF